MHIVTTLIIAMSPTPPGGPEFGFPQLRSARGLLGGAREPPRGEGRAGGQAVCHGPVVHPGPQTPGAGESPGRDLLGQGAQGGNQRKIT